MANQEDHPNGFVNNILVENPSIEDVLDPPNQPHQPAPPHQEDNEQPDEVGMDSTTSEVPPGLQYQLANEIAPQQEERIEFEGDRGGFSGIILFENPNLAEVTGLVNQPNQPAAPQQDDNRSKERLVGKECRSRWAPYP